MTRCILPTDIELAKKLLAAKRADSAIVTALTHRGIESAGAAQLIDDLRNGRPVSPQIPPGLEISPHRFRSRSRRRSSQSSTPPSSSTQPADRTTQTSDAVEPRHHRKQEAEAKPQQRKSASTLWLLGAVPVIFAAVIIGVLISNHLRSSRDDALPSASPPAASVRGPGSSVAANPASSQATASPMANQARSGAAQLPAAGVTNVPPQPH